MNESDKSRRGIKADKAVKSNALVCTVVFRSTLSVYLAPSRTEKIQQHSLRQTDGLYVPQTYQDSILRCNIPNTLFSGKGVCGASLAIGIPCLCLTTL